MIDIKISLYGTLLLAILRWDYYSAKVWKQKTGPEFVVTINRNASKMCKKWSVRYYSYFGYQQGVSFDSDSEEETSLPHWP